MDARLARMADVLVDYSLGVEGGDTVLVSGPLAAASFALAVQERVLAAGGHAQLRLQSEELEEALVRCGTTAQLEWVNPTTRRLYETVDCGVFLLAPANTRALTGTAAEANAARRRAQHELRELLESREQAGELRTVVTAVPTHALAQEADMSLRDYTDLVVAAGWLDDDDAVGAWRAFSERGARLAARLGQGTTVRVEADRTDITLDVAGRTWVAADGKQNFPDGEVYTAPHEGATQGRIRFPHATIIEGRRIEGVELTFVDGTVTEARADRGDADLQALLDTDEGARRVGELAIGLNGRIERFTGEPLFDEKIAGTVHLALGAAYPECGGTNVSALHWDLVCDLREQGRVHLDGEVVYEHGKFVAEWPRADVA